MLCTRGHAALATALLVTALAACGGARSDGAPPRKDDAPAGSAPASGSGSAGPVDPQVAAGAALYAKYCALCHGPEAKGYAADNAPSLVSRTFLESADNGFLARSIELGRPGTAMAAYGKDLNGPLTERDIASIVAWIRDKGDVREPIAAPAPMPGDPARGKELYTTLCQTCHGDPAARATAVHLANPTFLALASDGFLRYAIVFGRPGTPMEAFANRIDGNQVADLIAFMRSWSQPAPPKPETPVTPEVPNGPMVINPKGKAPAFTLRDNRFVAAVQVRDALAKKQRIVIIDARPPSDFTREHIPGSISVPHYDTAKLDKVPLDTVVVAYCACPHHASGIVVDELIKRGHKKAYVLDEGILFWRKQGYPIAGTTAAAGAAGVPAPPPMDHTGHDHPH